MGVPEQKHLKSDTFPIFILHKEGGLKNSDQTVKLPDSQSECKTAHNLKTSAFQALKSGLGKNKNVQHAYICKMWAPSPRSNGGKHALFDPHELNRKSLLGFLSKPQEDIITKPNLRDSLHILR